MTSNFAREPWPTRQQEQHHNEPLQVADELAAIAVAAAAEEHFARQRGKPGLPGRIKAAARGNEKCERGRLHRLHRFGHERQTVFESVRMNLDVPSDCLSVIMPATGTLKR